MKRVYYLLLLFLGGMSVVSCGIYNRYKPQEEVREDLYGENVLLETSCIKDLVEQDPLLADKAVITVGDSSGNMSQLNWREIFTDKKLQVLIEKALEKNADLRKAKLQVEAAEAMVKAARLSYLPSFALAPQGTLSYVDMSSTTAYTYNLPVSASWEIDIFGKLTNQKRSTVMAMEQTREYAQAVRCKVIETVANLYYTILTLDEQIMITAETSESWNKSLRLTKELKEAGLANDIAVAQTEAACYAVRASLSELTQQWDKCKNALLLMLMEAPGGEIDRSSWAEQSFSGKYELGVPVQMLSNRPDVKMAEAALAKAFYQTNAARADFYPSIVLSGSAGWTNLVGDVIVSPAEFIANALASLTQPLFAQGKLTAQLRAAKAAQEQAAIDFEYALLNAGKEVNEALEQYYLALVNTSLLAKQSESLKRAVESTQLMMDYGSLTYLQVLTAQQSYLSALLKESSNRLMMAQGIITLYSAVGGGQ